MTSQLILGDCLEILPTLSADSIDAIITDPPYGTTGVACANLGRKFIGIELEPKYMDIAKRRLGKWKYKENITSKEGQKRRKDFSINKVFSPR